jgi:hypothetical protein
MNCITDPNLQRLLELVEVDKQEMDRESLLYLLNSREGRWFLMRLLDKTDLFGNTFHADSLVNAYSEGRRSIGINILSDIKALGMDGLKLKQQAETEYASLIAESYEMKRKMMETMKEDTDGY